MTRDPWRRHKLATAMAAPPAYSSHTPAYSYTDAHTHAQPTPAYSDTPDASECTMQFTSLDTSLSNTVNSNFRLTHARTQPPVAPAVTDFIYKTDHMEVNLGSRVWGLRTPAYGRLGHVEGSIRFLGKQAHVSRVGVKLQAKISIRTSNFGQVSGQEDVRFLKQSITIYSPNRPSGSTTTWNGEHPFSFALPKTAKIKGSNAPLPPTGVICLPSTFCEVTYVLKIDMARKGLRRHERLTVPIYYLPKSRPSEPPAMSILWPRMSASECLYASHERISTVALTEGSPAAKPDNAHQRSTIKVSLPTPAIFTSGSRIPFTISFAFPSGAVMPALLIPNVRIELIKCTRLSRLGGLEIPQHAERVIGRADIENIKEVLGEAYGVTQTHLSGTIEAGHEGRESSWNVYAMVDVHYIVRIVVGPPRSMQAPRPQFREAVPNTQSV
ncbi:hypothetical protein FIBSPDRAFT_515443 [Athelia psychrophila]|uniref:Arrestin-like N-terminal domain-containing protein n=1 Tax=Athelia psychrophila TaxID=1759441 RepID=A0A166V3R6_9AGAM|nr:hypothetical protein FIBSPDRAFT_515443 [Fibularhizoctonia sp. CBS 109695]